MSNPALFAALLVISVSPLAAQTPQGHGFSKASLNGCYGAREAGDGDVSAGLGVVCYDGEGGTTRSLTVNAPDGAGGRRLLTFESKGTYTVSANGTGVATYLNKISNGETTTDHFDLVVTATAALWVPGRGQSRVASELFAVQREAGVTVSLVTSIQKRIADLDP